jgi:alanine racemase
VERTWCDIDTSALADNVRTFRRLVGERVLLAPAVKANGYGHGLSLAARAFVGAGADWLCTDSVDEAAAVRAAGVTAPVHIMGYVPLDDLPRVAALDASLVVYNAATVERMAALRCPLRVHLKLETGNHRQGVELHEALALAARLREIPGATLQGVCSHFANIEDTTDHAYARHQLTRFEDAVTALRAAGHEVPLRHLSNTAATLLWPDQRFEMVRVGLGAYGHWPSKETRVAALLTGRSDVALRPALTWKTRVAQVKDVPAGAFIGYGCTYMTTHTTRLAILPVGYADGFDRGASNLGWVLVGGRRAPVRGRVCMNILMVDVTDVPEVRLEDEVVLLGRQGDAVVSAEQMADWSGTIQYETLARIADHVSRHDRPGSGPPGWDETGAYRPPR